MNAPTLTLSDAFRAILSNVDKAHAGLGASVADMLSLGHAEYLTFAQFREAVKGGLSIAAWATVTNYMAPMGRAWEAGKIAEFCQAARDTGIKSALKLFPAGTGKRGTASGAVVAVAVEPAPAEAITAESLSARNDAAIAEAFKADEAETMRAENAALLAQVASLQAENAALLAQVASLQAKATKAKPRAVAMA